MSIFNSLYNRQLHRRIASIMALPLILTLLTGSLFQIASLTGKAGDFIWLLNFHKGKFGNLALQFIYLFSMFLVTGANMWLKTSYRKQRNR